ncbi:MAG: ammonium transporter [Caldilineaceae bacterium SB0664_bin_22]|nr:ammonium transporter [Caldilineaceae bacterium SB0664_bin_22]MYC63669.1 ammonium transporter [Caldilineaceae bacterium SB0661_bin_34]
MDGANTTFVLISTAMVMLMIPGLGLFYAGLVRAKSALSTVMQCFICMGVVGVVWVLWGYTLAFGESIGGFIGGFNHFALQGVALEDADGGLSPMLFMLFQGMFAAITPALLAGAFAERIKFSAFLVFVVLWSSLVYSPVAHWVWGGGWLGTLGALDFAGGNVVHMTSGVGALAAALVIGRRMGFPREPMEPHSIMLVLLGTGMLWFGWFGFNGGSALAADGIAVNAFVTTNTAAAAGALTWMLITWLFGGKPLGKPSAIGAASGAVAGLVAITPGAGFVEPMPALLIGIVAAIVSYAAIEFRIRRQLDDSLDVWGIHGMSGTWGALAVGLFASTTLGTDGGVFTGNGGQFVSQLIATVATWAYAFIVTWILFKLVDVVMKVRVSEADEAIGLDASQHGEQEGGAV